ncbi:MAG TPA: NAD(P)-dependent oxidoreductase [Verrucomicrobiales bacterium]|nr:NAD(P)-dependent oxidoreductase [Verrucomicrobiales bacterium]
MQKTTLSLRKRNHRHYYLMSSSLFEPEIGLIGVGLMGNALAERALESGFSVIGYDLIEERTLKLSNHGGIHASSAIEVAQSCDWLVYSVMTTEQVEASLEQCWEHLLPGQIIIDTSTGDPESMAKLGSRLAEIGVHYLDATIAGNSEETRRGEVMALVGGDAGAFQECMPFLRCFSKEVYHMGPTGHGARMKLVFNLVLGLHRAVLGEGLVFSEKIGIDRNTALNILKAGAAYSYVMESKGSKMLAGDFEPQAKLEQHLKDVNLMLSMGNRNNAHLPLCQKHKELLSQLVSEGHGALDNSAIIQAFE